MELIVFVSMVSEVALSMEVFPMPPETPANALCVTWASPNPSWYPSCVSNGSMVTLRAVETDGGKILDGWDLSVCHKERCDCTSSYRTHWQDKSFGLNVEQITGLMDCLPWWCHGFNNQRRCKYSIVYSACLKVSLWSRWRWKQETNPSLTSVWIAGLITQPGLGRKGVCCRQNKYM